MNIRGRFFSFKCIRLTCVGPESFVRVVDEGKEDQNTTT